MSILLLIATGFSIQSEAQVRNKDLEDWKKEGLLANFPGEGDTLQNSIRKVDVPLADFKTLFDECRREGKPDSRNKLRSQTESLPKLMDEVRKEIRNSRMYGVNPLVHGKPVPTSFLYFYLNAEIEAYLNSLELLEPEVRFLFSINNKADNTLNVFDDSNFLTPIILWHNASCCWFQGSGAWSGTFNWIAIRRTSLKKQRNCWTLLRVLTAESGIFKRSRGKQYYAYYAI
ncbi:hypothetical protein SNE25_21380 [Mucilaginibacter sabulilitoris]|uniref:Uncharacterized protein n=1 Tax=Mucilaginibacter sabulilitoris TaxID=1173583 RepID=A0ABZ0TFZ4_9SPHI|nr:hypothetical protein [Mucilaginibacter sabulilitoris]WPU91872.1 hypothetical protein SNE25_21380 [Mucilaginibacter sabulilitoris]